MTRHDVCRSTVVYSSSSGRTAQHRAKDAEYRRMVLAGIATCTCHVMHGIDCRGNLRIDVRLATNEAGRALHKRCGDRLHAADCPHCIALREDVAS